MKKICVFTSSRADYGVLKPLINLLSNDSSYELKILVSGTHLSKEHGFTINEIIEDGYTVNEKVDILYGSYTEVDICEVMSKALKGFSKALHSINPELLILLGDRYETFICAAVATVLKIPIAHIHGGELTEGAIDEVFRHSITKMSYLHFTSTEVYKKRVIQLGEDPERVFNVGALSIDNIKKIKLLNKNELENKLKIKFSKKNILVTYHPVTLEKSTSKVQFQNILNALNTLKETTIIFTKSNADTDSNIINEMMDEFIKDKDNIFSFSSLGMLNYLSLMSHVDLVLGNSSSGIIEAPSFNIATINVGDRQKGRIQAESIINC